MFFPFVQCASVKIWTANRTARMSWPGGPENNSVVLSASQRIKTCRWRKAAFFPTPFWLRLAACDSWSFNEQEARWSNSLTFVNLREMDILLFSNYYYNRNFILHGAKKNPNSAVSTADLHYLHEKEAAGEGIERAIEGCTEGCEVGGGMAETSHEEHVQFLYASDNLKNPALLRSGSCRLPSPNQFFILISTFERGVLKAVQHPCINTVRLIHPCMWMLLCD